MSAVADNARTRRPAALPVWAIATIAAGFGLFYAYAVWNALEFLISQASGPLGLNGAGWTLLLVAVVFPALAFGGAFALGWRRRAGELALILLTGLVIVAVFWMNVLAYAALNGASLLGG